MELVGSCKANCVVKADNLDDAIQRKSFSDDFIYHIRLVERNFEINKVRSVCLPIFKQI